MLSWVILAWGLVGRCSQDGGQGWHGAEDLTASWFPPLTVGERQQARGFDTERKPSKLRCPSAALVKGQCRAQHGRSKKVQS